MTETTSLIITTALAIDGQNEGRMECSHHHHLLRMYLLIGRKKWKMMRKTMLKSLHEHFLLIVMTNMKMKIQCEIVRCEEEKGIPWYHLFPRTWIISVSS